MAPTDAKRTSRWPTAPGRVSARRPTSFLCWCKERTQRKHLEYRTSIWESVIAGPCVQDLALFAASRKALLDSCHLPRRRHAHGGALGHPGRREPARQRGCFAATDECANGSSWRLWDRWPLSSKALREEPDRCRARVRGLRSADSHMGISGAFFAYFLCTSKESRSPAGAKSRPGAVGVRRPPRRTAMRRKPSATQRPRAGLRAADRVPRPSGCARWPASRCAPSARWRGRV